MQRDSLDAFASQAVASGSALANASEAAPSANWVSPPALAVRHAGWRCGLTWGGGEQDLDAELAALDARELKMFAGLSLGADDDTAMPRPAEVWRRHAQRAAARGGNNLPEEVKI